MTRHDWVPFAPHRAQVTRLLEQAAAAVGNRDAESSLCVLGAGNGNDLDLAVLCQRYDRITLVDLDDEALDHLIGSQITDSLSRQIEIVGGVDLSGMLEEQSGSSPGGDLSLEQWMERARNPAKPEPLSRYSVVASTCLLTQLIDSVAIATGKNWKASNAQVSPGQPIPEPALAERCLAIRDGHLRLLGELVAPGGVIVLITDFVSSNTLPELIDVEERDLGRLCSSAINGGNFFTGANPVVLAHSFKARIGRGILRSPPGTALALANGKPRIRRHGDHGSPGSLVHCQTLDFGLPGKGRILRPDSMPVLPRGFGR